MGTSINQRSPNTLPWNAATVAYQNPQVPTDRIPSLIWRAAQNQNKALKEALSNPAIFACQQAVRTSKTALEAIRKTNKSILKGKNNSIFVELGKRAISQSYLGKNPVNDWRSNFFSEVTNYMVSRDIPGYLGPSYRNKNISDQIRLKNEIRSAVQKTTSRISDEPKTQAAWKTFVQSTLKALTKT